MEANSKKMVRVQQDIKENRRISNKKYRISKFKIHLMTQHLHQGEKPNPSPRYTRLKAAGRFGSSWDEGEAG